MRALRPGGNHLGRGKLHHPGRGFFALDFPSIHAVLAEDHLDRHARLEVGHVACLGPLRHLAELGRNEEIDRSRDGQRRGDETPQAVDHGDVKLPARDLGLIRNRHIPKIRQTVAPECEHFVKFWKLYRAGPRGHPVRERYNRDNIRRVRMSGKALRLLAAGAKSRNAFPDSWPRGPWPPAWRFLPWAVRRSWSTAARRANSPYMNGAPSLPSQVLTGRPSRGCRLGGRRICRLSSSFSATNFKCGLSETVRMETPVLYFY